MSLRTFAARREPPSIDGSGSWSRSCSARSRRFLSSRSNAQIPCLRCSGERVLGGAAPSPTWSGSPSGHIPWGPRPTPRSASIGRKLAALGLRPTVQRRRARRNPRGQCRWRACEQHPGPDQGTPRPVTSSSSPTTTRCRDVPGPRTTGRVAAILEIARAITSGPPPRNDVDILFTDAEEPGLLGAQAFVDAGRLDPRRSVVLNLEARGRVGPA